MSESPLGPTDSDARLADALRTLASPTRLALLRRLREARTLKEIRVRPPHEGEGRMHQSLARQTVREHIDRLTEVGVLVARPAAREYGETTEYIVNHQALFALVEDLRALVRLRPHEPIESETRPTSAPVGLRWPACACLVLVHGLEEGRVFELPVAGRTGFLIGRRPDADVRIDFDPFVSSDNSMIEHVDGAFRLRDVPTSTNGTHLNFGRLRSGDNVALSTGDLVGVGRSILMFRAPP